MDKLRALVMQLACAERVGGRATVVDDRTLILYDCMHWSSSCTEVLLAQFPDVQISVRACRQSLSGYIVVFHRGGRLDQELLWYVVIGLGLACCGYVLMQPPWGLKNLLF